MPFPTPRDFTRLVREFTEHWTALNRMLLPEEPLLVLENLPVSALPALGERLAAAEEGIGPHQVELRLVRGAVRKAVQPLRRLTLDFNRWMRGNCARQPEAVALALVVGPDVSLDRVRAMARVTLHLWLRIDARWPIPFAFTPEQAFGANVADFAAAFEAFEAAVDARADAEVDEALLLAEAVFLRQQIVAVATAYGHAVQGRLREGDPRRVSLPALWHPGGHGPRRAGKVVK